MRVKFLLPAALLASTSILCALPVVARPQDNSQQTTDPVADAARRAREAKQQNANKPKKVYTDDDISRPKSAPATTPAPDASNAAEAAAIPSTPDKEKEKEKEKSDNSEATWRKRFKEQNDKIATAEKELDILQREGQKAQIQYYPDPQKAMTEQYTRKEINDKDAKIAAKQDEIAKLKQGLSDLEDQLRAAGGEPGWAR